MLREQAAAGWGAFRSYSEPGGIRDELAAVAARYPRLAKLVTIGRTVQGKPILAVKVTKNARQTRDGSRPATAYMGAQHAREWITVEMTRRLLHHVLDNYGTDAAITRLVNRTELWFVPVANPDGYDYTFTPGNRLWRKNLRDNNGDGQITAVDGVDLNRNFAYKWGYDNEGSSPDPSSETYRGPAPNSEPETRALDRLFRRVGFEFFINYHSAAELLLYGVGWQVSTPTPDDEIYKAMAGDDANPAVPGYDPDISAELYTTNGDTDTHMTVRYGTLGFTPEMTTCETASASDPDDEWLPEDCVSDFIFPDDEELIQAEFAKNIPFALAVARSALDPDDPVSVVGRSTPDFVIDPFDISYGTRQPVATIARRALRNVRMHYAVNGGRTRTVDVREWQGGERYGNTHDDYYAELRGTVTGTEAGDRGRGLVHRPQARRRAGGQRALHLHGARRHRRRRAGARRRGRHRDQPGAGRHRREVRRRDGAALTAAGRTSDVYDFDTQGRKAPHHLGVLSHYKAVVWETGDDIILRAPGQVAGTTMKAALEIELAVRDYLNEGGKLLLSGKYALYAQAANGAYFYNPNRRPAGVHDPDDRRACRCSTTSSSTGWAPTPTSTAAAPRPTARPTRWPGSPTRSPGGTADARRQPGPHGVVPADVELPAAGGVPVVRASSAPVDWVRPGAAPFDPFTGDWYVYSGQADESYKRLTRTVDLTGADQRASCGSAPRTRPRRTGTSCSSRRTRSAPTTGRRCRTPTATPATDTGESCAAGWVTSCTRSWPTTRRAAGTARRPAPPAPGTRPPGPPAAGRSGPSTCPRTPASRSSCRSPTSRTGEPRASACSSTTCRSPRTEPPSRRPRSRPTSAAGRWPGRRRAPRRTPPTGRAASSRSKRVRSWSPRTPSTPASGSRGWRRRSERLGRPVDAAPARWLPAVNPAAVPVNRR